MEISFVEVAVVVTIAGLVLGKNEVKRVARVFGRTIGRGIGTLQGIRVQMDEKASKNHVLGLHRSVKRDISSIQAIGADVSLLFSGGVSRSMVESAAGLAPSLSKVSNNNLTNVSELPNNGSNLVTISASSKHESPVPTMNRHVYNEKDDALLDETDRLAELIAAEKHLNRTHEHQREIESNACDVVMASINESIIMKSLSRHQSPLVDQLRQESEKVKTSSSSSPSS